jgi:hypothetical protein
MGKKAKGPRAAPTLAENGVRTSDLLNNRNGEVEKNVGSTENRRVALH